MKKYYAVPALIVVLASVCFAAGVNNDPFVTGDPALDNQFKLVDEQQKSGPSAKEAAKNIKGLYGLTDKDIFILTKKGYTLGQINYLAMLAKKSGKKATNVAAVHEKGVPWSKLADELNVKRNDLGKLRARQIRSERAAAKKLETAELRTRLATAEPRRAQKSAKPKNPVKQPVQKSWR